METYWEMMVARATPATPMWNTITNSRFRSTLIRPEIVRKYRGRLVSPTARSMEAQKL